MKERKRFFLWSSIIFALLIAPLIKGSTDQVRFYFYDEATNCSLNGYVFIGNELVGKTANGQFNLTKQTYMNKFAASPDISVFGILGDCFGSNLFFDKRWNTFNIEDNYFSSESVFNFKTSINQHNPFGRELLGFVQPGRVESELKKIKLQRKNTIEDLSEINRYLNENIEYAEDWDFGNETNYWQTPPETLKIGKGDCEDFSVALLSLFLAYNSSLDCHNIILSSHVTIFCHIDDYYIYYDQAKTELKKQIYETANSQDKISKLLELKEEYFAHYGINEAERAYFAFDNNELAEFKNDESFIQWQHHEEKNNSYVFGKLEKELKTIPPAAEEAEEAELAAQKPEIELAAEKPTISGFLKENLLLVSALAILCLALIIILIKTKIRHN